MNDEDLGRLHRLAERIRSATPHEPIDPIHDEIDLTQAYAVRQINTRHWRDAGRKLTGYKIALTAPALQKRFNVSEPICGALFDDMCVPSGTVFAADRFALPKLECELILELAADLTEEALSARDIRAAVGAICPALEIPDGRIVGDVTAVDLAADNAKASGYVLGEHRPFPSDLDLGDCTVSLIRNDQQIATAAGDSGYGPLNALAWLAKTQAALGEPLQAGQIVLTGALGPIIEPRPGDHFESRVSGIGTVSCSFA